MPRNLSNDGRKQAIQIGETVKAKGSDQAHVYSSQWCRCLDTARLLGLGDVEELELLNSFFRNRSAEPVQTAALTDWLANRPGDKPIVLVSHQVNITALTGIFPASGEIIFIRPRATGLPEVVGRHKTAW
jgi:broad specificity phosphatase PhoE